MMQFSADARRLRPFVALIAVIVALTACTGLGGEPRIVSTLPPPRTPAPTVEAVIQPDANAGAPIFALQCTSCHGQGGAGDGDLALDGSVPQMVSFTSADALRDITPRHWFDVITQGRIENLMPPWANALSTAERWHVTGYIFGLRYDPAQTAFGATLWAEHCADCATIPTQESLDLSDQDLFDRARDLLDAELDDDDLWAVVAYLRDDSFRAAADVATSAGDVTGIVINGTADGSPLAGLPVTLFTVNTRFEVEQYEATTGDDGAATFADVPLNAAYTYILGATHADRLFFSDFTRIEGESLAIPLTVYDLMADESQLTITDMLYQVTPVDGGVQLIQALTIRNDSDRAYSTGEQIAENLFASARVPLPRNGLLVDTPNDRDRFFIEESPPSLVDTVPVLPGESHTIQAMYFIPSGEAVTVEQAVAYDFDGELRVVIHPVTMTLSGEGLSPVVAEGEPTARYIGQFNLSAGEAVRFDLVRGVPTPESDDDNLWLLILISVGVGVLTFVIGMYLVNRFYKPAPDGDSRRTE